MLEAGVLERSYTTNIELTTGRTYSFKVEARTWVGYSLVSQPVNILAAQVPNKPNSPTTQISGEDIVVTWTIPEDGGSSIIGYIITFRHNDGTSFSEDTDCNGLTADVI